MLKSLLLALAVSFAVGCVEEPPATNTTPTTSVADTTSTTFAPATTTTTTLPAPCVSSCETTCEFSADDGEISCDILCSECV